MNFLTIFTRLCAAFALACAFACAGQAATILPPGTTQFFDNNGAPLAGGQIFFYIPGTTTPKSTYQNTAGTVLNPNPVILDSSGRAIIYGSGSYQETVEDANGNLIWNQITADTSSTTYSWAGTSGGSANIQTLTAPNFSLADGQVIGFIAGSTNTGALTFTVNGGSPLNVTKQTSTGPVALTGSEIFVGNTYTVTYSTTNGNLQLGYYPIAPVTISNIPGLGTGVAAALGNALNSTNGVLSYQSPVVTVYTSGSGTYTTPAGARRLSVEMIGGGSGGGGAGLTTTGGAGGIAGDTTFGASLTAQGGRATPTSGVYAYPAAATATGGDLNVPGALGGGIALNPNPAVMFGGAGAATVFGGGGPGATQFNGTSYTPAGAGASFGSGGGGGSANIGSIANIITGWGGNAGAFLKKSITSPLATYAYGVGAGGTAGTGGTDGSAGAVGAGGVIIVTAYFQ